MRFPRRLLPLVVGVLVLSSCGSSTAPLNLDLFMSFKANGTLIQYTEPAGLLVALTTSATQFSAAISGIDPTTDSHVAITLWDDAAIAPGTFTGFTVVGMSTVGVTLSYENAAGTNYTAAVGAATVVISDVTDTRLRGTFSGVVSAPGTSDVAITEGQFSVGRIN